MILGRRRRTLIALLVVVALAAGGAGAWVGATTGSRATQASWSIAGTADSGRVLLINGPTSGACEEPTVETTEDDEQVTVTAQLRIGRGAGVCPLIAFGRKTYAVRLEKPLAGRRVTGPRKRLTPPDNVDVDGRYSRLQMTRSAESVPKRSPPSVRGLRYQDARDALCNAGFQAVRSNAQPGKTYVVRQDEPEEQPDPATARVPGCTNGVLPIVRVHETAR